MNHDKEGMKIRVHHEKPQSHEAHHSHEHHKSAERPKHTPEHPHHKHAKLEQARTKAEHEAVSARETPVEHQDKTHQPKQAYVNQELKEMAYQRTISRVRRQLSPMGRLTSKVIHQPVVNAVSEATGKTIGRPSGLLGGAMLAFVGTSIYYYVTKHYGYEYSYTVFLVLLGAGFVAGWLFEAIYRLLRPSK